MLCRGACFRLHPVVGEAADGSRIDGINLRFISSREAHKITFDKSFSTAHAKGAMT